MISSLFSIRLKIITGYAILVLLFLLLLVLVYSQNINMLAVDCRSEMLFAQREQAENITMQILDLSLFSEQVVIWNQENIEVYENKQHQVITSLIELQKQLKEEHQRQRIASIISALSAKKILTLAMANDVKALHSTNAIIAKRIPTIIQHTKQEKQNLAKQIEDNYKTKDKKKGGFLGLFISKKKINDQVEKHNDTILKQNQAHSGVLLHSLVREIQHAHKERSAQLYFRVDSLNRQNTYLNNEISRLITEFNIDEQNQRRQKAETYLLGQERSLRIVSGLGLCAMCLAIVFYIILHRDLKNRYRYRQQLEDLNLRNEDLLRSRKNMMLMISHDLRAPLSSIRGCAELVMEERYKDKRNHFCNTILQSSNRMIDMLNALLSFYRLDTGKEQPDVIPFRLKNLAEILESEFRPLAQKTNLKFTVDYQGEDVVVAGDRQRLIQIGSNLLSNAFKFTPEGNVTLKLSYTEGTLKLEVSDTGVGMSQQQIDRIFLPFERLESAEAHEGFGLGLSITLGLIGLLNGKIEVKSEFAKGSTFVVAIPLALPNEQSLKQVSNQFVNIQQGIRVLVIDDDAVLLKMTQDMLLRYQIICDTCKNVQELTKLMRKYQYDLLITDIRMPNINGYELLELLRASDIGTSRTIPVLALTARVEYNEENFTRAGFVTGLYKPFSINELLSAVQRSIKSLPEETVLQVDFSKLLSGENNGSEMLELLIHETDKSIHTLIRYLEISDRESIILMIHHLLPLWEIVRMDMSLNNLRNVLAEEADITDNVKDALNKVVEAGELIMSQAAEQIKKEKHE
jgi:signal transduction histidine kinase/DNA-binding NarL/FixJ family response regulator